MTLEPDPTRRLPSTVLIILTVAAALALLVAVVVALVVWHTAPMQPVNVPSVAQG